MSSLAGQSLVAFLGNGQLDTLALWQRDESLGGLTNDENVGQTGGENVTGGILDVHDFERSRVLLTLDHSTATTQIPSAGDHTQVSGFELEHVHHLTGGDIVLDRIVLVNDRIRVTDGATVVGQNEWHLLRANLDALHLQQLVL